MEIYGRYVIRYLREFEENVCETFLVQYWHIISTQYMVFINTCISITDTGKKNTKFYLGFL